jgi:hypothetical protein
MPSHPSTTKTAEHTPGPWTVMESWPLEIVELPEARKSLGGSVYEKDDKERFAHPIATVHLDTHSGFAHRRVNKERAKADARLIASSPVMYAFIVKRAEEGDADAARIISSI